MFKVTIIIPCFNEERYIERFLLNLKTQTFIHESEIIIADGMSTDSTIDKIKRFQKCNPSLNLILIENYEKIVPTGLNKAICAASAKIIVRMDVHTTYNNDYVEKCYNGLVDNSSIICIGGAWRAVGETNFQKDLIEVFMNKYILGGAASRKLAYTGEVDTVYLGAWRKLDLINVGLFDETLIRNQDDELCLRFRKEGGIIWQHSDIISYYTVRNSYNKLAQQFWQYGFWKTRVLRKHFQTGASRHFIPAIFVSVILCLFIGAIFSKMMLIILITILFIYLTFVSITFKFSENISIISCIRKIMMAFIIHIAYGSGFLWGLLNKGKKYDGKTYEISR